MEIYTPPATGNNAFDTYFAWLIEILRRISIGQFTPFQTFADGDTTPAVGDGVCFKTANTGATTISDFDDGLDGQFIVVVINDSDTTVDFTSSGLKGNGGGDWSPAAGDFMICIYDGTDWYCNVVDTTA